MEMVRREGGREGERASSYLGTDVTTPVPFPMEMVRRGSV
jgi:hypothetical protein